MPSWKRVIVSGSNAALNTLNVTTAFTASGLNYPSSDNGEESFIQTDGNGNLSLQYVKTIYEEIVNGEPTQLVKGTPVYVSESQGAASIVYRADAGDPNKMPVIYITADTLEPGQTGRGIALGLIKGVNTTGYPAGTEIYVAVGGGWTSTRPTGSAIVQTLGYVTKEGNGGQGVVLNPGPNSLPNLPSGSVWVGNSSSIPTPVSTSSLSVASASFAQNVPSSSLTGSFVTLDTNQTITGNKTFTPVQNSTPLTISGYSLTGSNAQPLLDLSGTWNTTGTPTLIRANVTNTASNANSLLMDLQVGAASVFRLQRNGILTFNGVGSTLSIYGQQNGGTNASTFAGFAFRSSLSSNITGPDFEFLNGQANSALTSGSGIVIRINRTFVPTSGTATYTSLQVSQTINQTGGANGITRGLHISPTLTSAADWRSIEWSNNIGRGLYGVGTATNNIQGDTGIGLLTTPSAKLHVRGSGATSTTTALRVENSTPTTLLTVQDNGQFTYNTPTMSLATTSSAYAINLNISQSNVVGAQVYGVNLTPTFFSTTGSQTQTALRVNAVFTGSAAATSGSNIIADFGSTNAGSQLTVTDITSGSIYMVNDVSGLPIIEATSDWTVSMYDFPNRVFRKTGSVIELGVQNNTGSAVNLFADTILNEGLGFTYRTTQTSGSTIGAVTSSIWNINFSSISSSVYVNAVITGFDTGSRDTITGDIKATIRYRAGVASVVGTNQTFINSDNAGVSFNIVAGGTSGSLQVYGSGSTTYQWGATITTQVI